MRRVVSLIVLAAFFMGCASVLNPYESDFDCPETGRGKCVSVRDAYGESLEKNPSTGGKKDAGDTAKQKREDGKESGKPGPEEREITNYHASRYRELSGLLQEPVTPLVAPPKVMRVLLLPYTGDANELYMMRYIYFFVEGPKWILGNYPSGGVNE